MRQKFSIKHIPQLWKEIVNRSKDAAEFAWIGVWRTPRHNCWISTLKVVNLSIRSFLDKNLQSKSMALTYSTVLSIVPALALLFAIARGFGFQALMESTLYSYFPSQSRAISTAMGFVDSYLKEAKQGVFVGIGILMLLWTLISLLSNIEAAFNQIWDVKQQRSFYRKFADYTAICLLVPIIMLCQSGVSIFMSATVSDHLSFLSPLWSVVLDCMPIILAIVAFTLSFLLIPNTKVQFRYALLAGTVCGIAFTVLQLLFVNGQIYVSKYNAIYGSFAFLPLLLIWLQLSWLILLFGCMLCYSAQNVLAFNYTDTFKDIPAQSFRTVAIVIMTIVMRRQKLGKAPMSVTQIAADYSLPIRMVSTICGKLHDAKLVYYVNEDNDKEGVAPAVDLSTFTLGEFLRRIDSYGQSPFIPGFDSRYAALIKQVHDTLSEPFSTADKLCMSDLILPPAENRK